jgi:type II secretory pathway pseudopilin PulG
MVLRQGATLIEVLVAIFITAIGLLALLALFPLGVISMSRAIQEERAAECCGNAISAMRWAGRDSGTTTSPKPVDLRVDAMVNPYFTQPPNAPTATGTLLPVRSGSVRGYPVFVDPVGFYNNGTTTPPFAIAQAWVGRTAGTDPLTVPRVAPVPQFYGSWLQTIKWCTLLDDITFGDGSAANPFDGTPHPFGALLIQRDERYSWAYLLTMPSLTSPSTIYVTVVVYKNRRLQVGSGVGLDDEILFPPGQVTLTAPNTISLSWGAAQTKPTIRKGTWVFDATIDPAVPGSPRGYFYRVSNVTDTSATSMDLETETNLQASASGGVIVVMPNVIEVFDRIGKKGAP